MYIEDVTKTHHVLVGARKGYRPTTEDGDDFAWRTDGVHLLLTDGEGGMLRICTVAEARQIAQLLTRAADALSEQEG